MADSEIHDTAKAFVPGDRALHKNNQLDARPVAAVEGDMIRLDIFGLITEPVPASNYINLGAPS